MITIITDSVSLKKVKEMAASGFGNLVKGVVDIERKILSLNGDLHADEEAALIEDGSEQKNIWGINIYPALPYPDRIEFDSMINVRPSQGNMTRNVDDPKKQEKIIEIVKNMIGE